ncbi:MAG: YkuS family protein [Clostridia bacterium]|nr:YkuS family protein [Clostridia bacterium]
MKNIKIAIQKGLDEVKQVLINEGFDVHDYDSPGLDADVTIVTGIDEAYEEIEPVQFHKNGDRNMLVIDATNVTPETVLKRVHQYYK